MLNTEQDTGCIFDDPQYSISHPIIDFNSTKASDLVFKIALYRRVGRFKPVVVVARGMGGGKTRALEEIRRNFLLRSKVLPVAITFNCHSDIENDGWWDLNQKDKFPKYFALSVVTRMVSSVLSIPYDTASDIVVRDASCIDFNLLSSLEVIRLAIAFLVERVNQGRASLSPPVDPVDTFVLLMDESRKVDHFSKLNDLGRVVREALLNQKIAPKLNVSLVISDLGFLPENLRRSSRELVVLTLPARLSVECVLKDWFLPTGKHLKLSAEQRAALGLVVVSMNNMPRALDFTAVFLQDPENADRPIDRALLFDLYAHVFERAESNYKPLLPSLRVLTAVFFRESIPLDDELFQACTCSVVTNPMDCVQPYEVIVPDASLVLLKIASERSLKYSNTPVAKVIKQGIDGILNMLSAIEPARPVGDVLEETVLQALRIRLVLARANDCIGDMTLSRIFGLNQDIAKDVNAITNRAIVAKLKIPNTELAKEVVQLSASSNNVDERSSFLVELDGIEVSKSVQVRILKSALGDSWDICIKAHNEATGQPFYVFLDCKSGREFEDGKALQEPPFLSNPKQYKDTATVLGPSRQLLYVYCSTHNVESKVLLSAVYKGEKQEEKCENSHDCVVLGREDTLNLVGPFSEIYSVARASYSDTLKKSSEQAAQGE